MDFREFLKENNVLLDGGMGTLLQSAGMKPGERPERWCITHGEEITAIQKSYFDAGSNVVNTNTFGANVLSFDEDELDKIVCAAVACAKRARELSTSQKPKFISLDIGPTGRLLKPFGDLDFEEAVEIFAKTVRLGVKYGVDLVTVETMNDSYETKAAVLAVKENSSLPIIVTNAYGADGKLMTGASPEVMATLLEGLNVDMLGANCSLGPKALLPVAKRLLAVSGIPIAIKPNAGIPREIDGATVFDVSPEEFASDIKELLSLGVRAVGGCCGTTPEYIKLLDTLVTETKPCPAIDKGRTAVCSYSGCAVLGGAPVLIGERINPTGKKRFKQALVEDDLDYILGEGVKQEESGAHILDVNVGIPDIDEAEMLPRVVRELQAITPLPLCIDTADYSAMERALRVYNGKAVINSVNGKAESMQRIFPLAKKYGGVIIALTLDENGIPDTVEGRLEIANRILLEAKKHGIAKKDIVFDPLAMTVSAAQDSASVTLRCIDKIRNSFGIHTSLGVSNISFGLPNREIINSTFFALAMERGLSMAIMNPLSASMMNAWYSYRALKGLDENFADYIKSVKEQGTLASTAKNNNESKSESVGLKGAIIKGLKEASGSLCEELLSTKAPIYVVNEEIVPALDEVGRGYESGRLFLPSLLMSAEAASFAFEKIKAAMPKNEKGDMPKIVTATVKGDIHDIGKNIVKLLLENYGFEVIDLGKDVPPELIADTVAREGARLVCLSALMTTTVPAMEEAVALLHERFPDCKVMAGGAVMTEEYSKKIKADAYAKDAMEAVRYAQRLFFEG